MKINDYTFDLIEDKETWESFLAKQAEANFLQSYNWGNFYEALGNKVYRIGFYKNQNLQGVMLAIVERAKRATYLTVPAGPIVDWDDRNLVKLFEDALVEIGRIEKAAFARVRPQLPDNEKTQKLFKDDLKMRTAPMHLHAQLTNQLQLDKTEAELLVAMRKNTRYEIRKADKLGIKVTTSQDPANIKDFHDLQLKTAARQHFVPFAYEYWYEQFKVLAKDNQTILYSAYLENELLAQAMIIFYGTEGVYHYGASTETARKYPGAYAIQWEAIKEAKRRGLQRYNFWGVAPEDEKEHRFASLSTFKRGFGGEDLAYLPAHDYVLQSTPYFINWTVETLRQKIRKV